jgi:cell division initiation protein
MKKQEFKRVKRGLDPIEVQTYLEMVADEFEAILDDNNRLSDELIKVKTQLKDYQKVETTFKQSLVSAQQTIKQSRDNSAREADLMIKDAELKADKILEDAKMRLIDMKNELMVIKSHKDSFAKRLRHLLESQLELLGVLEIDDLGIRKVQKGRHPQENRKSDDDHHVPPRLNVRETMEAMKDARQKSDQDRTKGAEKPESNKDNISNEIIM